MLLDDVWLFYLPLIEAIITLLFYRRDDTEREEGILFAVSLLTAFSLRKSDKY